MCGCICCRKNAISVRFVNSHVLVFKSWCMIAPSFTSCVNLRKKSSLLCLIDSVSGSKSIFIKAVNNHARLSLSLALYFGSLDSKVSCILL